MKFNRSKLASPLGELALVTDEQHRLRALQFSDRESRLQQALSSFGGAGHLVEAETPIDIATSLGRYFQGHLEAIDDIAVAPAGDEFRRAVWSALRRIPPGRTASYGELARALGYDDPRAAIDVGAANASNPIAIVIPCHRVLGRNGDLKGYAWGPHRKRWLLEHEKALPPKVDVAPAETVRLPGF